MNNFVHLHTHSHYSLLDGLPKIYELVERAKKFGCPALALTDHGNMFGAIEFYKECKKQGVKPIIGMEAYMALETIDQKRAKVDDDYHHLTLLAMNEQGYKNLMQLTSIAYLKGFYYKPRVDKNLLRAHSKGLIALSGCLRGEIPRLIIRGQYEEAKRLALEFRDIFGKDNFYGEIQHHPDIEKQETVNQGIFKLCGELGMKAVVTCDNHYLNLDDREAQDILVCVQTGKFVADKDRLNMTNADLSMKSPDELTAFWKDHPEAIKNTLEIAERCNLELELDKWVFPKYPVPENKTCLEYLRESVWAAAKGRYGDPMPPDTQKRIEYELDVIDKTGFATYFLIVSDFVKWARGQGIIVTTRGSAAGSIVSYLIDITTVDPLYFKLPFERFLTVARPSPPDIDVDFADNRRDEVIGYVRDKYGHDKVAQICTFGKMLPRAAVRDVVRVLGLPYSFGDKLAKMIPVGSQGFHMTVDRALEENPDLAKAYNEDSQVKKVFDLARKVEGCARHASVHAAGVVIAPAELTDFTPLQREAQGDNIITQYDMHAVESAGLIKIDMLGIRNLSILGNAVKIVKHTKGVEVDIGNIPLDDKKTFKLLARGDTMGVFQLSGSGMTRYLKDLKPSNIHDIMAMVALFRPGPIESIPEYIKRKNDPRHISYLVPELKPILERTFGVLVYQDDILYIAVELAGYTWEEADKLRKAIGKKIPREMIAQREKFINGCVNPVRSKPPQAAAAVPAAGRTSNGVKNGMPRASAEELWRHIEPFAAYGFNKSHAASYAMVAYQTAYMKAHYPAEFITAILTAESGNTDKLVEVISSASDSGIVVLPPDVNESRKDFTYVDDKTIRFGLLAIKNLGTDVVEAIIAERDNAPPLTPLPNHPQPLLGKEGRGEKTIQFPPLPEGRLGGVGARGVGAQYRDLEDFLKRVQHKNLNKKSLESLVKSGAMDCLGERGQMLENMEEMLSFNRRATQGPSKQTSLFIGLPEVNKLNLKQTPPATKEEKLEWEKQLLGLYVSSHPLDNFKADLEGKVVRANALTDLPERSEVCIAGVIMERKIRTTRQGEQMAILRLQDLTGSCEVVVFPKAYRDNPIIWNGGALLIVWGRGGGEERRVVAERAMALTRETLQEVTGGYKRLQEVTGGYKRLQEVTGSSATSSSPLQQRVVLTLKSDDRETLETLRTFLVSTRGSLPVYIALEQNGHKRTVQTDFKMDADNIKAAEEIVGDGMVKIDKVYYNY